MLLDLARKDTICALATAPAPAAIALIRVSGAGSKTILQQVFTPRKKRQTDFISTFGNVHFPCGERIDEALCVFFPEGKSYTGEASFELSIHGGLFLIQRTLEALKKAGCRLAEPGEFTMRAVLTGKLDLVAAESVHDLIAARSKEAASSALTSLKGGLLAFLEPARNALVDSLCEIEARLDFPDEDLGESSVARISESLSQAIQKLQSLLETADYGLRLMQGARVVLLGKPNVGKSTLLNALVREDKALVHDVPGTTRDVLEGEWVVAGIPITLVDVAGIREHPDMDPVERMGIERAHKELDKADMVLLLDDGQGQVAYEGDSPTIAVRTKQDLGEAELSPQTIGISAKTREGIAALEERVSQLLVQNKQASEEVVLTKARQVEEVKTAHNALVLAKEAFDQNQMPEITAAELRRSGKALDRLLGKTLQDDVLDLIFSRFCIGK